MGVALRTMGVGDGVMNSNELSDLDGVSVEGRNGNKL